MGTHASCFTAWLGSVFVLKKEATISILKKRKVKRKNYEKESLLYINIDSKYLSINIKLGNITGREGSVGKIYGSFRRLRVFVFSYRVNNENAELVENFL